MEVNPLLACSRPVSCCCELHTGGSPTCVPFSPPSLPVVSLLQTMVCVFFTWLRWWGSAAWKRAAARIVKGCSWTVRNLSVGQETHSRTAQKSKDVGEENTSLQRELEKEMRAYLHGENQRLKMEIEGLRAQKKLQKQVEAKKLEVLDREKKELQNQIEQVRNEQMSSTWSEVSATAERAKTDVALEDTR